MLTVACVRWGTKYSDGYVRRLRNMCSRNLPEHKFVCLTDQPNIEGVWCRPLPSKLPTWWSKVGLFKPGTFHDDDVLYLDLDVVITGQLGGLVELLYGDRSRLWALDDFSYSIVKPKVGIGSETARLLGGPGTVNSSVMMWHGDICSEVWERFYPEVMHNVHGDQNWITQVLWPNINLIPKRWASSYKYGGNGVIRVFHGDPKPDKVHDDMVAEHWK